ncbi:hypothetical protein CDL12_00012 [Handroanthus impetiginosus]|uniref:Uncharacterized protein n=1 Tax=Handroanthus impetiginosus TaxID=429701 RepID=A0A2G9IBU3_9LAMI|nr:hypothetical protein CDL12_00012 [Handroanthus impetiginosus]
MSPLPLSTIINLPVTVVGSFLVRHYRGRYLFTCHDSKAAVEVQFDAGSQLIDAWNRELMSCVRDSYIKLILEMQKLRKDPLTSVLDPNLGHSVSIILGAYRDEIYSFWPRSGRNALVKQPIDDKDSTSMKSLNADWECLIEKVIMLFYARLVELPVWQLYSGNLVKAAEGMFLSQPRSGLGDNLLPATVCAFVKEHYPVFSVPWELVTEIQALGIAVREIKPKMVRDLLRASSPSMGSWSIDTYVDVLEYCLSDIQVLVSSASNELQSPGDFSNPDFGSLSKENHSFAVSGTNSRGHGNFLPTSGNSGGDAIEMMTSLGRALFDFGRGVVEDMGRGGGSSSRRHHLTGVAGYGPYGFSISEDQKLFYISNEIKGLPCPTAKNSLVKLGLTEVWIGNRDEQSLITPLAGKFIHPEVLERPVLGNIFFNCSIQSFLKLQAFSLHLLAIHMRYVFHETWANHVLGSTNAPWFSWEKSASSGSEAGPSPEWIRLFWKIFSGSSEDLSLFSDWPLIPAFLGRPILCRVRDRHLVFIPAPIRNLDSLNVTSEVGASEVSQPEYSSESHEVQEYLLSFKFIEGNYPWLFSLLNQCNIPIFDFNYMDYARPAKCLPQDGLSLGQIIASKLVAAKQAGYLPQLTSFSASQRDELFGLFASDFHSSSTGYGREELEVLRDLPIYRTVLGTYTHLEGQDLCMISSNTFLKPSDDRCLSHSTNSTECSLLRALGIPELHDQQILVKLGLPGFEHKP